MNRLALTASVLQQPGSNWHGYGVLTVLAVCRSGWSHEERLQGWRYIRQERLARTADGRVFTRVSAKGSIKATAQAVKINLRRERRVVLSAAGEGCSLRALQVLAQLPGVLSSREAQQLRIQAEYQHKCWPGKHGQGLAYNFSLELCGSEDGNMAPASNGKHASADISRIQMASAELSVHGQARHTAAVAKPQVQQQHALPAAAAFRLCTAAADLQADPPVAAASVIGNHSINVLSEHALPSLQHGRLAQHMDNSAVTLNGWFSSSDSRGSNGSSTISSTRSSSSGSSRSDGGSSNGGLLYAQLQSNKNGYLQAISIGYEGSSLQSTSTSTSSSSTTGTASSNSSTTSTNSTSLQRVHSISSMGAACQQLHHANHPAASTRLAPECFTCTTGSNFLPVSLRASAHCSCSDGSSGLGIGNHSSVNGKHVLHGQAAVHTHASSNCWCQHLGQPVKLRPRQDQQQTQQQQQQQHAAQQQKSIVATCNDSHSRVQQFWQQATHLELGTNALGMADAIEAGFQRGKVLCVHVAYSKHAARVVEAAAIVGRRLQRAVSEGFPTGQRNENCLFLACKEGAVHRNSGCKHGIHLYFYT